jgi:hypothetical protein
MRRVLEQTARGTTGASVPPIGMFCVVLAMFLSLATFALSLEPPRLVYASDRAQLVIGREVFLQLWLLVAFATMFLAWMGLHALRFLGAGSGAGFRLMLAGVAAHVLVTASRLLLGGSSGFTVYEVLPNPVVASCVANGSLIAYGCGAALVVATSSIDCVRWRRSAPWIRTLD